MDLQFARTVPVMKVSIVEATDDPLVFESFEFFLPLEVPRGASTKRIHEHAMGVHRALLAITGCLKNLDDGTNFHPSLLATIENSIKVRGGLTIFVTRYEEKGRAQPGMRKAHFILGWSTVMSKITAGMAEYRKQRR